MPFRVRRSRVFAIVAAVGIVSAPLGWVTVDRLEADNDFCNACHLAPGRPLHAGIRRDFDGDPPASLAALHARAPDSDFRCIDCHGGTSPVGRLRVKVLAAKDAFWYVVGHFDEPTEMRWPLWDEDCLKCHERFDETPVEAWQSPRFHQLPVHNVDLGVPCVECHRAHDAGGNPEAFFLQTRAVRAQCARCHAKFEEGTG